MLLRWPLLKFNFTYIVMFSGYFTEPFLWFLIIIFLFLKWTKNENFFQLNTFAAIIMFCGGHSSSHNWNMPWNNFWYSCIYIWYTSRPHVPYLVHVLVNVLLKMEVVIRNYFIDEYLIKSVLNNRSKSV